MGLKPNSLFLSILTLFLYTTTTQFQSTQTQLPTNTTGYTCTPTTTPNTTGPFCQAYAFYRAKGPDFLDLGSIGDLFSVSRLMISNPSNISSPALPLVPNQPLLVPLQCSCNYVNATLSLSYANLTYTIKSGDTFYHVSTEPFQNLTTYQSVMAVNPTLVATNLSIGANVFFPIFCKCPNRTQLGDTANFVISYVFQPNDTLQSIASFFGSSVESIANFNGGTSFVPSDTVFVPVSRIPSLTQPQNSSIPSPHRRERTGLVIGLGIGLGICGFLAILVGGFWGYRENQWRKRRGIEEGKEMGKGGNGNGKEGMMVKKMDVKLIGDVSGCLDKYRVYEMDELREATDGFDERWFIHGSVYRGCVDGELCAIKKMNWNASEELKILQKVNHGNLVKLEGFCIDPEDASCYLVYEYVENGSLHSWLHENKQEKLSWKTRLRIAVDVANGLQYIHEHTRPRVVHKDIKSSNILLDSNMRAKIANFGLAKSGHNAITVHIVGTQGYTAPEYLSDGVVSTKMDVFSFGVVLLELVSGEEAVDEEGKFLWTRVSGIWEGKEKEKERRLKGVMDDFLLGESCSMESVMNVINVAVACLHRDPSKRPSMVDIVYALCKSDELFFDVSEDGLSPRQVMAR